MRLLVVSIVAMMVVGCGMGRPSRLREDGPLRFAFITCTVGAKFFGPVKKGVRDAAQMMRVEADFLGTEGVDVPAQAAMVRRAVRDGYDGIALNLIDPEAFDDVVQETIDRA